MVILESNEPSECSARERELILVAEDYGITSIPVLLIYAAMDGIGGLRRLGRAGGRKKGTPKLSRGSRYLLHRATCWWPTRPPRVCM